MTIHGVDVIRDRLLDDHHMSGQMSDVLHEAHHRAVDDLHSDGHQTNETDDHYATPLNENHQRGLHLMDGQNLDDHLKDGRHKNVKNALPHRELREVHGVRHLQLNDLKTNDLNLDGHQTNVTDDRYGNHENVNHQHDHHLMGDLNQMKDGHWSSAKIHQRDRLTTDDQNLKKNRVMKNHRDLMKDARNHHEKKMNLNGH